MREDENADEDPDKMVDVHYSRSFWFPFFSTFMVLVCLSVKDDCDLYKYWGRRNWLIFNFYASNISCACEIFM